MAITPMQNLTYGLLSNAAYKNGAVPPGWSIVDTSAQSMGTSPTGFAAVTFKNQSTGEIVIAYRGTDEFGDASNNFVQLALQNDVPGQLIEAQAYFDKAQQKYGVTPVVVGHSLGGALAQLVSAFNATVSAFTYNAPGVYEIYKAKLNALTNGTSEPAAAESFTRINNTNMSLDLVSDVGKQMGSMINYPPDSLEGLKFFGAVMASLANPTLGVLLFGNSALGQHYMDRVLEAIATPKPTDSINGYNFNKDTGNWERPSSDGSPPVPVDAETAASLNAQLAQNIQYNDQVNREVRPMLLQYRVWEEVTQQYTANNGQVWLAFDPNCDQYAVVRNTKGEPVATYEAVEENGKLLLKPVDGMGQTVNLTDGTVTGTGTLFNNLTKEIGSLLEPTGAQTLTNALAGVGNTINTYAPTLIDALSLLKAIQSGNPLPIAASGLRLANNLSTQTDANGKQIAGNYSLAGASTVGSAILSLMSLDAALKRGDTMAAVTAGAQTLTYGATAYALLAQQNNLLSGSQALAAEFGAESLIVGLDKAMPYLNLVNSIAHGDAVGAAMAVISMTPAAPIAWAYYAFNMITSLFGDDDPPPEPWGNAWAGWSGFTAVANSNGGDGGQGTAAETYNGFISYLNQLAAYEQSVNPGSAIGIVANRLPSLSYRNYTGFGITDIDAITGIQRDPSIRYDLTGRPYNAPPGSYQASQSLSERFIRVALARGAVAPMWEVQTAAIQTQYGDPQAGLTEEERAGRNGKLAAPVTGDTQTFRAVALDLNGDGVQTTGANKTVAFDIDDSGFMKNTAWLNNNDGFLFLDRNLNGSIDSGRELFSNSIVDLSARGLAGMRWVDSNYDGKLTAADPVWNELKIWQDANGDGQAEAGEVKSLAALGITALDYAMGRFEQNGQLKEMSSPDLAADTAGTRTHVIPEGIVVETTSGHTSLLVTRIDDRMVIEANRDGVEAANEPLYFCERMAA